MDYPSPPPRAAARRASIDASPDDKPRYSWHSRTSETAAARNPLARHKDDRAAVFDRTSQQPTQTSQSMDDDLWDDDDEEEVQVPTPKKKNARKKQVSSTEKPKPPPRRRSDSSASPAAKPKPVAKPRGAPPSDAPPVVKRPVAAKPDPLAPYPNSRIVASDDKYSSNNLIPEFEIANVYDPEAGPLEIGPDEANRFHVPTSINRYLFPYQREGIEFMASALIDFGGALLGAKTSCSH